MDYTITTLTAGNAVVTFADGGWANVPVLAADTKAVFEKRVQGFAPKTVGSNPAWIAASQTGSIAQVAFADHDDSGTEAADANPAWLKARITAYGAVVTQVEFITENGLAAWVTEVNAIKAANPKP